MPINREKLKLAISTIQKDEEDGFFSSSMLVKSWMHISLNTREGIKFPPISSFIQYIYQDVSNIETITSRLDWQRELWKNNKLDVGKWMSYAACDIDIFHIEMRSIFDYVAKVIQRISNQPKQVPDEGFNVLKTWLANKKKNTERLGEDLAELVLSVNWFEDLKNIRDKTVHQGAMTLVFLEKDKILFQIHKGIENLVNIPEIMYNPNVVIFELYAAMYFGYLVAFLEDFASVIKEHLPRGKFSFGAGNPRKQYREIPIIYSWIEELLKMKKVMS